MIEDLIAFKELVEQLIASTTEVEELACIVNVGTMHRRIQREADGYRRAGDFAEANLRDVLAKAISSFEEVARQFRVVQVQHNTPTD